ncbi:MAG: hypothetical protein CMO30_03265 [Tistrella sp.]|jgi:hypothetical protein|uniref:Uncharacterized protein n=1 Tax=Tistrella mobilis TaxID=171437 RepID=A0A3B9IST1_9PROT|nr:radical SAM protein [Tistrella sp.]MAD39738.1 hypothetical protein [Tistrella sp.]MBA74292.1 hypothetical protein [Tistrella sp.]HAE50373.1 hypothetical protein [Tistrella mobilis]
MATRMNVYIIAPGLMFSRDALASDQVLHLDRTYAFVAAAGITTVAAFFDGRFKLRLCDELIEPVDFDDPADVICLSINVAQVTRGLEIARRFRAMGRTVVMGGAHVSLAPELFEGEADCLVVGEFEPVAGQFVDDLYAGRLAARYQGGRADLATSRPPRWDLYPNDRAICGVVQTSRGCPFDCEFCDVIQYVGRVQRHKPVDAVLTEVQLLYDHGYRNVNISDDNFTVYRQRTHALLDALIAWNGRDGRDPVQFHTQASIDLARDEDVLAKCAAAGVRQIFVGLETNDEGALKEARKRQNLHQNLVEQCQRIVSAGISLDAGLMVGFDSDDLGCFERQFDFGMALPAVNLRVAVLIAPIATPLYARLKAQGRLLDDVGHEAVSGGSPWTNMRPLNMTREQLAEGALWLVDALMHPDNVIRRFEHLASLLKPAPEHLRRSARRKFRNAGASASLNVILKGMKDPGGSRVIEAVNALTKSRPEIAQDLSSALAIYLNSYMSIRTLRQARPRQVPDALPARFPVSLSG